MPDGRMLKRKISLNEAVADLANDTHRMLFTWGIAHLDVKGRISGSPRQFKAIVAPLLDHIKNKTIEDFFEDAQAKGLILRYRVGDVQVIEYPKFTDPDNQKLNPDREAKSRYPDPPTTPDLLLSNSGVSQDPDKSTPDLIPLSLSLSLIKDKEKDMADSPKANGRDFSKEFEAFYEEYPRQKGKKDARECYLQIGKKGLLPPLEIILAALGDQKTWPERKEVKYLKYPKVWLKGECWNDRPDIDKSLGRDKYESKPDHFIIDQDAPVN